MLSAELLEVQLNGLVKYGCKYTYRLLHFLVPTLFGLYEFIN